MSTSPVSFTTTAEKISLTIDNVPYELRELDGIERDRYLNRANKRLERSADGTKIKNYNHEGAQADLISKSLFDTAGQNVPAATINRWGAKTITALYKLAQKLSALDNEEKAQEEAKNESPENEESGSN